MTTMSNASASDPYSSASLLAGREDLNRVVMILNFSSNNDHHNASAILNATTAFPATPAASGGYEHPILTVLPYLSVAVSSFGMICSVLTLLTLRDPDLKEAPYTYLTAIAVSDLSTLCLAFCLNLSAIFKDYISHTSYAYSWWSAYFYYPLVNVACTMTTWIMVVMTVERCLYIQWPFQVRTHFTIKRTRIKIMLVFLGSFVINFPRFLWYKPVPYVRPHVGNDSNAYVVGPYLHGGSFAVVVTWIHSALSCVVPLILLIFLNAFLIWKFRYKRSQSFQLGISRTIVTIWDREQTRMTFTYIAIVGLFIVLITPSSFADENISKAVFGANRHQEGVLLFQNISNFLVWFNLALVFALYAFINTKFKIAFKLMLRRWRARLRNLCCRACLLCRDADVKRDKWSEGNTFYMANHDEQVPFNNNKKKNRLQSQQSNMSTTSKENSSFTTVTFKLLDG